MHGARSAVAAGDGEQSDEKVESEEQYAQEQKEGAPREAAARELRDRVNKTGGDDEEARFAAPFIERAGGNVAGEVAPEEGELVVHPEEKLGAVTPKRGSSEHKGEIAQES